VNHGVNVFFNNPVGLKGSTGNEQHVSLAEVLSIILRKELILPKIFDYKLSRQLSRTGSSGTQDKVLRLLSAKRNCPVYGTMFPRRVMNLDM
jgi:hypothetical protein